MPTYTVHEPPEKTRRASDDTLAHSARFVFVRDGFHFWSFLFGPLWMLRYRMWLETIVYLVLVGLLTFALLSFGAGGSAGWVAFLVALLLGMEAPSLRRWKLSRRGYENVGVVVGDDIEDAERRFFDGWTDGVRPVSAPPASPAARQAAEPPGEIIGLFPQPGTRP
jgi:hypothetical protein